MRSADDHLATETGPASAGLIEAMVLTPDDWPRWRELRLAALAEAPEAFGSALDQWSGAGDTEERWRSRLEEVPLNLVLLRAGLPVGMVAATHTEAGQPVHLISMWVAPHARGRGVGDEAIREVLGWAGRAHPGSEVGLSVKPGNAAAIRLYRRHGFVDVGPSPDDSDERWMTRPAP